MKAYDETKNNQTWTTDELVQDFKVKGFSLGYVVVQRRSDGVIGSLNFTHRPRRYFDFIKD
tara:strand:- start:462 stop:644 length:183 start_codon:yes stop_codon:yes gene_type:complete